MSREKECGGFTLLEQRNEHSSILLASMDLMNCSMLISFGSRQRGKVKTSYMKRFADYDEMKLMADVGKDVEVGKLCRMVEQWKTSCRKLLGKSPLRPPRKMRPK